MDMRLLLVSTRLIAKLLPFDVIIGNVITKLPIDASARYIS
jgi:hypothetical protein